MEAQDRVEILAEIVRERLPSVQRIIEEWSVPEGEAVSYAQLKDLIWQLAAPLGLSMLGFSAAERARREVGASTDPEILAASEFFARVGDNAGQALERFLSVADSIRP